MSKRRYRAPKPQATGVIYESGQQMYDEMNWSIMRDGIDIAPGESPTAVQYGANRWLFNMTGVVSDVFAPLPSPNIFTYPAHRWQRYLWDYIGPEGIRSMRYRMRMGMAGQGDAMWLTHIKKHPDNMAPHNEKGNCFVGVTFRSNPIPSVTLISRTVMLTPMGVLDIAFGILLARVWAKMLNNPTPPIFSWQVPSICVVPHFNTIILLKNGHLNDHLSFDPNTNSKRSDKRFEKVGRHYDGKYTLNMPEIMHDEDYPHVMLKNTVKRTKDFIETDDWVTGEVYDQYRRMQQKCKKYLYGEESTPRWVPSLPDIWFDDLMGKTRKWAKDYKNDPLPEYPVMEKQDFPRGQLIGNEAWEQVSSEDKEYLK